MNKCLVHPEVMASNKRGRDEVSGTSLRKCISVCSPIYPSHSRRCSHQENDLSGTLGFDAEVENVKIENVILSLLRQWILLKAQLS